MYNDYKFTYANIDKTSFEKELGKRGAYYSNVVIWTTLFSLPFFFLVDYLFCKDLWIDFMLVRIIGATASYIVFFNAKQNNWDYLKTTGLFIGIAVVTHSLITALVPTEVGSPLAYFLILSIIFLIISTTIFWPARYSIFMGLLSIAVVLFVYSVKTLPNKYLTLVEQGGVVYVIICAFSCLLAYTRFNVLCRDAEKSIMIDEANNKLIEKTELIREEQFKTEEANRRLKSVSESSLDNMTVLANDFKSYSDTVKDTLDTLKSNAGNLMPSQLEILDNLSVDTEKLNYVTEKLGGTASAINDVNAAEPTKQFIKEDFDINAEVERAVMDIAEGAMLKGMSLQLNISPAMNNVYQDKLFTQQALSKLMNNVIKLSQSGSIITVRSEWVSDKAMIELVSHGTIIGMERLEEMMSKLKHSSVSDESALTDLGLLATKKLVESMDGTFKYNSENKTGNYFKIEFPSSNPIPENN